MSRSLSSVRNIIKGHFNDFDMTISYKEHDTIFPYSGLYDEEIMLLVIPKVITPYRSHRLVLKIEDKRKAFVKSASRGHLMASIDICPRRLIDTRTFKLVKFGENDTVPSYAILSHRWIKGEEIFYQEFLRPRSTTYSKSGYRKIRTACQKAYRDGIWYIWVDTCCFKKGDRDDVIANITSRYAYYQNAEVCYAYLVDVPGPRKRFEKSEWFKRGWTLQELLAPRTVIFFNENWNTIGDKHQLRSDIQRATTIPAGVLSGEQSIQDVDVFTRVAWATKRFTTKIQDRAYCLQGLLGVSVEPDYSESCHSAFYRLGKTLFNAQPELKKSRGMLLLSHRLVQEKGDKTFVQNSDSPALMASTEICPHRLIDTYTLKVVEFDQKSAIPAYAILSHRWIKGEEVLYSEFIAPHAETFLKPGYQKIEAACQQACSDNIHYIWIDTCCIEQGDHKDVTMNITSMYAYYQNSEVCYVYLMDFNRMEGMFDQRLLAQSEWFERGWTLQELLAPQTVIFFDQFWQCTGDRYDLQYEIHRATNIPCTVLSGQQSIQDIDVLTRMSWATRRETTKRQDEAYCLQGLLGVMVEPNYDEDWWNSFNRLGKALFDAQPELKKRLGIKDELFQDPGSDSFYIMLQDRFSNSLRTYTE
ncbi:hypothetical protein VKT23_015731, partial [Stygiomarasmius scandens]